MFPTTTGSASFTVTLRNEPATVRFAMDVGVALEPGDLVTLSGDLGDLRALTVNPVAPHSHSFDSLRLRGLARGGNPRRPSLDVRDTSNLVPAA